MTLCVWQNCVFDGGVKTKLQLGPSEVGVMGDESAYANMDTKPHPGICHTVCLHARLPVLPAAPCRPPPPQ